MFTDGSNFSEPIAICDYKRVFEDDKGPNTGGMGCYTPPEFWTVSFVIILLKILSLLLIYAKKSDTICRTRRNYAD